jgi:hypothetical protein
MHLMTMKMNWKRERETGKAKSLAEWAARLSSLQVLKPARSSDAAQKYPAG